MTSSTNSNTAEAPTNPPRATSPPPQPLPPATSAETRATPHELAAFYTLVDRRVQACTLCRYARRDAELSERAATQAETLFGEDSLVVVDLRRGQALALGNNAHEAVEGAERDALFLQTWALVLPLHDVLLRRVASNTLLPGTIRQEEIDYQVHLEAALRKAMNKPALSHAGLHSFGQLGGYSTLLDVVQVTLNLLSVPCSPAHEASAQSFVLAGLDVIPHTTGVKSVVASEPTLVTLVEDMPNYQYNPAFRDAVLRKWRSPAVRSVLQSRGTLQAGCTVNERNNAEFEAGRRADIEKIGLRECAWPSCEKVERIVREFKQCSGCRSVWYCSPEHHRLDWGEHKKACGELDATRRRAQTRTNEPIARDVD